MVYMIVPGRITLFQKYDAVIKIRFYNNFLCSHQVLCTRPRRILTSKSKFLRAGDIKGEEINRIELEHDRMKWTQIILDCAEIKWDNIKTDSPYITIMFKFRVDEFVAFVVNIPDFSLNA